MRGAPNILWRKVRGHEPPLLERLNSFLSLMWYGVLSSFRWRRGAHFFVWEWPQTYFGERCGGTCPLCYNDLTAFFLSCDMECYLLLGDEEGPIFSNERGLKHTLEKSAKGTCPLCPPYTDAHDSDWLINSLLNWLIDWSIDWLVLSIDWYSTWPAALLYSEHLGKFLQSYNPVYCPNPKRTLTG